MAMAVAWSYFHKKCEKKSDLSRSFLIIAPNIIVFERLREDFESGKIFQIGTSSPRSGSMIGKYRLSCVVKSRKTTTEGTLYLTNIHQLYEDKRVLMRSIQ